MSTTENAAEQQGQGQGHWIGGLREGYAKAGDVQLHVADLGVAFTKPAEPVSLPRLFRRVLGCAHCYLPGLY